MSGCKIHVFLTSALLGGEWPALLPNLFTPGKNCMGPRGGLYDNEEAEILYPTGTRNPTPWLQYYMFLV
jgi:hypothetical protein